MSPRLARALRRAVEFCKTGGFSEMDRIEGRSIHEALEERCPVCGVPPLRDCIEDAMGPAIYSATPWVHRMRMRRYRQTIADARRAAGI